MTPIPHQRSSQPSPQSVCYSPWSTRPRHGPYTSLRRFGITSNEQSVLRHNKTIFTNASTSGVLSQLSPGLTITSNANTDNITSGIGSAISVLINTSRNRLRLESHISRRLITTRMFLPTVLHTTTLRLISDRATGVNDGRHIFGGLGLLDAGSHHGFLRDGFLSLSGG